MNKYYTAAGMLSFFLCITGTSNSMDKRLQPSQEEIADIVRQAQLASQQVNAQQIVQEFRQDQAQQRALQEQELEQRFRDQNTLLCKMGTGIFSLGLYKRDLVEAMLVVLNIAADILLYKKLNAIRFTRVYDSLLHKHSEFEAVLLKVQADQQKWQQEYDQKNALMKALTPVEQQKRMLVKPIIDYISKEHRYISSNPFKYDTFVPLFIRFAVEKLGQQMENELIVKNYRPRDLRDFYAGFVRNEQGELVRCAPTPSLTTAFKALRGLVTPTSWFRTMPPFCWILPENIPASCINGWGKVIKFYNPEIMGKKQTTVLPQEDSSGLQDIKNFALKKVHDVFTSRYVPATTDFLILGMAAYMFDYINNTFWVEYIIQNQDRLLDLLQKYRQEKESFGDISKLKTLEQKIHQFVSDGHTTMGPLSLIRWFNTHYVAYGKAAFYTFLPLAIVGVWKGYGWYKANCT